MKKLFTLFAASLSFGLASAQTTESAFVDASAFTEKTDVEAGYEFCKSNSVSMKAEFSDKYVASDLYSTAEGTVKVETLSINGVEYTVSKGVAGNNNPKNSAGKEADLSSSLPAEGAVFQFDVEADGELFVVLKTNNGKEYYVWEGLEANSTTKFCAYTYTGYPETDGNEVSFSLPSPNKDGYFFDFSAAPTSDDQYKRYFNGSNKLQSVGTIGGFSAGESIVTALSFQVSAGKSYILYGRGTKPAVQGYVFVKDGGATAVDSVNASLEDGEDAIYNLLGQRVENGYKGVAIKNGKLVILK